MIILTAKPDGLQNFITSIRQKEFINFKNSLKMVPPRIGIGNKKE